MNSVFQSRSRAVAVALGAALAGMLSATSLVGQTTANASAGVQVPDAQVEANVLRALASAPELSTQNIQSATVYGTVTLSGNVHDEPLRLKAENLAARAQGVKKVVDQLTLGDTPAPAADAVAAADPANGNVAVGTGAQAQDSAQPGPGMVLQSDGTYAPADGSGSAQQGASPQAGDPPPPPGVQGSNNAPGYNNQQAYGNQPGNNNQPGYNNQAGYNNQPGYNQPGYGPQGPPPGRQPLAPGNYAYQPPPGVQPGQQAGIPVTVPAGAVVNIRINRGLDSQHVQPGATFDGTVLTDIVSNGVVAVPRGATVQGNVVDAKKAGVFKGEGTIALQLNTLTLGGNVYPLNTQVWVREGRDKTAGTVNRTAGTAAFGAIIGALAGGGEGAAIGAGVGGAAGLAGSAAGPRGQVLIPPESSLRFTTAQPTALRTVSQAEMARLAYAAGPGQPVRPPMRRYYSPYYGYYYAPAPGYYR